MSTVFGPFDYTLSRFSKKCPYTFRTYQKMSTNQAGGFLLNLILPRKVHRQNDLAKKSPQLGGRLPAPCRPANGRFAHRRTTTFAVPCEADGGSAEEQPPKE
jgi:hypothetical protein